MSMSNTDYLDDQLAALQNAYAVFTSTSCFDKDDCDGLLRCMQVLVESCVQSPATRRRNHKHAAENRLKRSKRDQYHAEQKRLWTSTASLARSIFEANALISEREFHMCRLIASLDFSNDIVIKEVGDVLRESHMKHLQRKVHLLKKYKQLTNSDFVLTPDFVPNKAPTSPNKAAEGPSNTSNMLKPKKIPRIKHSRDFGVKASESQLSKSEKEAKHLLASDKACKTGKSNQQSGLPTRQYVADFDDSFGQNQKHQEYQDFQKHQEHQERQERQTHQYVHGHQHQKQHQNLHQKLTTGRVANRHLRSSSSYRATRRKDHSDADIDDHQAESLSTSTNSGSCSPHTSQHTLLIQPSHPKKLQMKSFLVCPEQPGVESLLQQTEQSEQSEVSGRSERHLHSVQQIDVQQADHTYHAETHQADSDCDASAGAEEYPDKFQVDQTGNLNKKHKKHKSHKSMRKSFLNKKHKHKHAQAYQKPYLLGSDEETGCSQKSHSSRKSQIKQTSHASQKSRESYKSDRSYRSDKSKESSKSHKSKESSKSHRSQHSNRSEHSGHSEKSYESSEQEPVHLPKVYFVNHVALVGQIPRIASKSQTQQNSQGFSNATSPANSEGFEQQGNLHDLQSEQALVVPLSASQQQQNQQQHQHHQQQMEYSDLEQLVGEVFRAAAELEDIDSSSEDSGSASLAR